MELDDIRQAAERLAGEVRRTPCERSETLSRLSGADVWLKFENLQFTASFKERGALNCLKQLSDAERARGVIAMSAGNHAQALAYHGQRLGVPTVIVMPRSTPNAKVEQTRVFGAEIHLEGNVFDETKSYAEALAAERGLVLVHPYDDERVIAGQGTVALEVLEQVRDLDVVVVPIGGGGLIGGMAVAIKALAPAVEVVGVQVERFNAVAAALRGEPPRQAPPATVAEGIAVKSPGRLTLPLIREHVDAVLEVSEEQVEDAVFKLIEIEKSVSEGAGAASLAAVLAHPDRFRDRRCALVVSGGNVDMLVLASILERGMVRSGRLVRLQVEIPDVPGALGDLTHLIGEFGANIIDIAQERTFGGSSVRSTLVQLSLSMRGQEDSSRVLDGLRAQGYEVALI